MKEEIPRGKVVSTPDKERFGVANCARCGCDHPSLAWRRFSGQRNPFYEFWAPCPANGEPILLRSILGDGTPFRYDEAGVAANHSIEILLQTETLKP